MNNITITTTTLATPRTTMPLPEEVVLAMAIRNSYMWVLAAVGFPGNLACLVTVLSMPVTTATIYVALLAVADSLALLVKLIFHQIATHGRMTKAACVLYFAPSFFSCYANWVLVLICFERFFAVCFPLKKQVFFTKRRVYISIVSLSVALAICFSPTPMFYPDVNPSGKYCIKNKNEDIQDFMSSFFDFFLLFLYFFLPFLMVAIFTTLIIVGLQRHRRARQRMGISVSGGSAAATDGSVERSISIMLLAAGLVFLLLTLPACLYHLFLEDTFDLTVLKEKAQAYLFYQVITMLSDVNNAVNFLIYFLSAAKFRKRFVELLKRCLRLAPCKALSTTSPASEDATHLTNISQSVPPAKNMPDSTTSC